MPNDKSDFLSQLRTFVAAHPDGWNHHEWLELLAQLTDAGEDTTNPDAVGAMLERERLLGFLEGVGLKGLGPKRREAGADRFGRLWDLRHASVADIASIPGFYPALAEALHEALR
ncbi:MAG: hypothetical protein FIA95_17065 [Gemmatimonadetes bacterium]|nr:hypothetical protein [Gemmatimonadota bacterium]